MTETEMLCPNHQHAPHGCGLFNVRYETVIDGKRKVTWRCRSCFDKNVVIVPPEPSRAADNEGL